MSNANNTPPSFSKRYLKAALNANEAAAAQILDHALQQGLSAKAVYLSVLLPAQRELGKLWHTGKISVATEHIATQITLSQMGRLRPLFKRKKPHGKTAVVTSVCGDSHHIGGRMVSDLLFIDGWEVDFLGADTPSQEIFNFTQSRKPDLLGLSITVQSCFDKVSEVINLIKKNKLRPKIVVGGLAVQEDRSKFAELEVDALVSDSKEMLSTVRELVGLPQAYRSLEERLRIIGDKISNQRKSLRMSQQNLGDSAGLDRAYISSIEHGKQNITIGALVRISHALDLSLEELIEEEA